MSRVNSYPNKQIHQKKSSRTILLYILNKGSTISVTMRMGILNFLIFMFYIQGIVISVNALHKDKLTSHAPQCKKNVSKHVETTIYPYTTHVYSRIKMRWGIKMSRVKLKIYYFYYPFYIYGRKSYRFVIVQVQLYILFLLHIFEIVLKTSVKDNRNISSNSPAIQYSYA